MAAAKKIKMLLVDRDMTMTDLARVLNQSTANISNKMRRDNFSEKDLIQIANALGYEYSIVFTDKNTGKTI